MRILAHRGYHENGTERNSPAALRKALEQGFGFESDIRDYRGELVISHNIADAKAQKAEEVFGWLREFKDQYCFAINVKADGLKELLTLFLKKYQIANYFAFDMSVPQMLEYSEAGIRFFTRESEYEREPALYEKADGVWMDAFADDGWITEELIKKHIASHKKVCIVSPDLHRRQHEAFWERLHSFDLGSPDIMLCTDYPGRAKQFFGGDCHGKD